MSFAIIGIGCRFPGGVRHPKSFMNSLLSGQDAIGGRPIPDSRWDRNSFYEANPQTRGKIHTLEGGFISDVPLFDPAFFGISPIEAERMDPQQRLLLETSYRALEDAGMKLDQISEVKWVFLLEFQPMITEIFNNFLRAREHRGPYQHGILLRLQYCRQSTELLLQLAWSECGYRYGCHPP